MLRHVVFKRERLGWRWGDSNGGDAERPSRNQKMSEVTGEVLVAFSAAGDIMEAHCGSASDRCGLQTYVWPGPALRHEGVHEKEENPGKRNSMELL